MTPTLSRPDSFLAAIVAEPDDDAPRLVYCDWLEEQGDVTRAEFLRVQCELAKWTYRDQTCQYCKVLCGNNKSKYCDRSPEGDPNGKNSHKWIDTREPLRRRELELWRELPVAKLFAPWAIEICERCGGTGYPSVGGLLVQSSSHKCQSCKGIIQGIVTDPDSTRFWIDKQNLPCGPLCTVRRGFVERVELTMAQFVGGECERCEGTGMHRYFPDINGEPNYSDSTECFDCKGTTHIDAIAGRLFRDAPTIREVVTADLENRLWTHRGSSRWHRHELPREIFSRLAPDGFVNNFACYNSRNAALVDLNAALVQHGRDEAAKLQETADV